MRQCYFLFFSFSFLLIPGLGAQTIALSPQVIGVQGGDFANNDFEISYTVGELAAVATLVNVSDNFGLTQGFHQPDKYTVVTGIEGPLEFSSASLFPNPASNLIHFSIGSIHPEKCNVEIIDVSGRKVFSHANLMVLPGFQTIDFPLSEIAAGSYQLRVISSSGSIQQSFQFIKSNP
jgi:hypothetical protein